MDAPIPTPRNDDDEDVHWALSTAGALWARGERTEALKWLRRAAEQASDVNADTRALELFKAAAEVASQVSTPSAPPPKALPSAAPAPPAPPSAAPPAPPAQQAVPARMSAVPPAPAARPVPPAPTSSVPAAPPAATPAPPSAQSHPPAPQASPGSQAPAPAQVRRPPPAPPRPGSVYPPPPIGSAPPPPPRPGSVYPPPPVAAKPAPPQAPAPGPMRAAVPTVHGMPPAPPPAPARPVAAFDPSASTPKPPPHATSAALRPPPVVPPARSVSITTAKPDAPPPAQPKRRRSFTGETRASDRARTDTPRKGRRRTFEEELTLPRAQIPAKAAPPAPPTEPHLGGALADVPHTAGFDDLDEDTRVLQNKPGGGHEDLAEQAKDRMHAREPAPRAPRDEPATEPKPAAAAPAVPPADDDEPGPQSQNTRVWTHVPDMGAPETERPGKGAVAAARPTKKLETIPALRVAALATSVPGEVRLIALEGGEDAPSGAALALLVPLTAADGEAVARLFRG